MAELLPEGGSAVGLNKNLLYWEQCLFFIPLSHPLSSGLFS